MSNIGKFEYGHANFGPFLFHTKAPKYLIDRLLKDGNKLRKKHSYNKHLAGHLKNQFLYEQSTQKWFYDEIQPYLQAYREGHNNFHGTKEEHQKLDVELQPDDLWVNYMKPGDFNPPHTHGSDFSFVFFLDVPKELFKEQEEHEGTSASPGALIFEYTQMARPRWSTTGIYRYPETGDFYMFPALLSHWVCPFKSKVTRISVSGNLRIMNRATLPHDFF